jgi:AsmA protein
MKRLLLIGGAVVVLLLAAAVAAPFLVDPNRFRPMLVSQLSQSLGREVALGDLKLSLLKGTVAAADLSIGDDPAYSRNPFLTAKSISIGVEMWPLIWSRRLHVTGVTIDQPAVVLLQSPSGEWNFSSLGGREVKQKQTQPAPASESAKTDLDLSVKSVKIADGRFTLGHAGGRLRPITLQNVDVTVQNFSAASPFPFTFQAKVAGGGAIHLDGQAGPLNPDDEAATPTSATWKVEALDLAGAGLTQTAPGFAGLISFEGQGQSDGRIVHLKGKLRANKLKLAKDGTPAKKPVEFDFALDHDVRKRSGHLRQGTIRVGSAPASLTGTYAEQNETPSLHMIFDAPKMAVAELSELLPPLAIVLPRGASLQGGTATAKMTIEGPTDHLVTAGTMSLDNTKVAGFDLGRKMAFVEALAGI